LAKQVALFTRRSDEIQPCSQLNQGVATSYNVEMIDNDAGDLISDKRKWAKTLRENKAAVRQAIATDNPDKAVEAIWRYMLRLVGIRRFHDLNHDRIRRHGEMPDHRVGDVLHQCALLIQRAPFYRMDIYLRHCIFPFDRLNPVTADNIARCSR
jgi:hypothetical protein